MKNTQQIISSLSITEGGFFTTGINDDAEMQEEHAKIAPKKKNKF